MLLWSAEHLVIIVIATVTEMIVTVIVTATVMMDNQGWHNEHCIVM